MASLRTVLQLAIISLTLFYGRVTQFVNPCSSKDVFCRSPFLDAIVVLNGSRYLFQDNCLMTVNINNNQIVALSNLSPTDNYVAEAAYFSSQDNGIVILANLYRLPAVEPPTSTAFLLRDNVVFPMQTAPAWLAKVQLLRNTNLPDDFTFSLWWRNYCVFESNGFIYVIQGFRYFSYNIATDTAFGPFTIDEFGLEPHDQITGWYSETAQGFYFLSSWGYKLFRPSVAMSERIQGLLTNGQLLRLPSSITGC